MLMCIKRIYYGKRKQIQQLYTHTHTEFVLLSPSLLPPSSPSSLLSIAENVNKGLMKEINRLQLYLSVLLMD